MGRAQSPSAAGSGPLTTPTPSSVASMISRRSIAIETAWRTRTSLHGFWSVRIARSFTTLEGNSTVRRVVLVDEQLDPVDVWQPGHEVAGVADHGERHVRPVALEHPRPGADHRLRLLEVAPLLHALAGHDAARHRARHHVEEPGEGLGEREPHRVAVDRLDLRDRAVHRRVAARLGQHALEGELHV